MSDLTEFTVGRRHLGDQITDDGVEQRLFEEGDTRRAKPADVTALVKSGTLVAPKAKADAEPLENKAEGAAPDNKARKAAAHKG